MISFAVAFALLLHVFFWGAGLAVLAMPGRWRQFWPVIVFPAGFALQSAVVWIAAYANLPGTNSYAYASEILPAALLGVAWWPQRASLTFAALRRMRGVFLEVAVCLALLVLPLALASKGLTTISLGSCDAADYAGGARTLMEFAHADRTGFLGLAEVVTVHSVDNFFDYWLRTNHFTPSALIALNGSVLHCAPHELTSLMTMVILASSLPVVFWMARVVVGLRRGASLLVAALYGVSPVTWYPVAQVSPGQLLAAPAIALVTWAGFALWRATAVRLTWRRDLEFAGLLAIAYGIILGSYNFFLLVCLVPAVAFAGGLALRGWQLRRFLAWAGAMLAPLVVCGGFFFTRVAGLAERFTLLRSYDFGWRIRPLTPEGWLGFLRDAVTFEPLGLVVRGVILIGVLVLVIAALRGRRAVAWRAAVLTLPALAGYLFLQWRGATLGTNASYDAYKLLAVFFPGVLAVSMVWLRGWDGARRTRLCAMVALIAVSIAQAQGLSQYFHALKSPPFLVPLELRDVRRIEAMPDVASVNMLLPDMWSRLWANAFLLRKPQYFRTHTYEARLNTPLRGDWDLQTGLVAVRLSNDASRVVTPAISIVDTRHPAFIRAELPAAEKAIDGWHAEETLRGTREHWRWTQENARIRVHNPHAYPIAIVASLDANSVMERDVALVREGGDAAAAASVLARVGPARATVRLPPLEIPPGDSILVLRSNQSPAAPPGDPRLLGVCVFRLILEAGR